MEEGEGKLGTDKKNGKYRTLKGIGKSVSFPYNSLNLRT